MGRKTKPTNLKVIEGNPGKRKIKQEPDFQSDMPSPPSHLDDYAVEEWGRLAPGLHALGILYATDRSVFAAYCQAYSRWRTAEELIQRAAKAGGDGLSSMTTKKTLMKHPLVGISEKAAAAMMKYALEFGLSPSARARLAIDPGKAKKGSLEAKGLIGGPGKRG